MIYRHRAANDAKRISGGMRETIPSGKRCQALTQKLTGNDPKRQTMPSEAAATIGKRSQAAIDAKRSGGAIWETIPSGNRCQAHMQQRPKGGNLYPPPIGIEICIHRCIDPLVYRITTSKKGKSIHSTNGCRDRYRCIDPLMYNYHGQKKEIYTLHQYIQRYISVYRPTGV